MFQTRALRILLAEDNLDHAELIVDALQELTIDHRIVHVTDGESLLKYLRRQPPFDADDIERPDLILLDLKMPRMDGLSALRAIRHDESLKSIPILMVTTSSIPSEIQACFESGASNYLTKPVRLEEFNQKISELNLPSVATQLPPNTI